MRKYVSTSPQYCIQIIAISHLCNLPALAVEPQARCKAAVYSADTGRVYVVDGDGTPRWFVSIPGDRPASASVSPNASSIAIVPTLGGDQIVIASGASSAQTITIGTDKVGGYGPISSVNWGPSGLQIVRRGASESMFGFATSNWVLPTSLSYAYGDAIGSDCAHLARRNRAVCTNGDQLTVDGASVFDLDPIPAIVPASDSLAEVTFSGLGQLTTLSTFPPLNGSVVASSSSGVIMKFESESFGFMQTSMAAGQGVSFSVDGTFFRFKLLSSTSGATTAKVYKSTSPIRRIQRVFAISDSSIGALVGDGVSPGGTLLTWLDAGSLSLPLQLSGQSRSNTFPSRGAVHRVRALNAYTLEVVDEVGVFEVDFSVWGARLTDALFPRAFQVGPVVARPSTLTVGTLGALPVVDWRCPNVSGP